MPTYNKLVRDGIPSIIAADGKTFRSRILDEQEYIKELRIKLREETEEYLSAENKEQALEELADMLEVIHALSETHGSTPVDLEQLRVKKANKRGGFSDRVFLIDVVEA
ncbi:nucleoside triphosphate pyrophosphohydrolase [Paenibacillus monticola]|uniref:Phosphoribosyl-ATP pyrophosphohydrolase n=1 Tax=Paenibacillus monticola TaxID=2666075 RepID=A0A7X2HA91_9BACL|nr:nucleoside triphosphate pyrophosphohydrolase [Paenibacillus monticola]MRN56285.1 phosphoribosyl-ATP pyrophosphohydrolase [Paenibacillus monticola]